MPNNITKCILFYAITINQLREERRRCSYIFYSFLITFTDMLCFLVWLQILWGVTCFQPWELPLVFLERWMYEQWTVSACVVLRMSLSSFWKIILLTMRCLTDICFPLSAVWLKHLTAWFSPLFFMKIQVLFLLEFPSMWQIILLLLLSRFSCGVVCLFMCLVILLVVAKCVSLTVCSLWYSASSEAQSWACA